MHASLRVVLVVLGVLLASVPAQAQTSFTQFVIVGDSLAAGFTNGALVDTHQQRSVPALIARAAAAADFQQPLISEPGIPIELTLVSLVPAPVLQPKAATAGAPRNLGLARAYNNLAVPGATAVDALTRTTDAGGLHDIILRGRGTQVQQAVGLRPTATLVWIGNNDVLGAAVRGRALDGVTLTPVAVFRATYSQIISAVKNAGGFVVAANLPDVTTIPFVTTIKPYLLDPGTGEPILVGGQRIPLIGPAGPLPPEAFVTLAAAGLLAAGQGIPTAVGGRGTPLPDEVILDPAEVAIIRDHVNQNNRAIAEICTAASVPLLDLHALLEEIHTRGRTIAGVTLTSTFLSGGVFGYDGIHPTDLGYAVLANEWIRVINESGGSVPYVDVGPYLGVTATAQSMAGRHGMVEFTEDAWRSLLTVFPPVNRD